MSDEILAQHTRVVDVPALVDDKERVLVKGLLGLGAESPADAHGSSEWILPACWWQ